MGNDSLGNPSYQPTKSTRETWTLRGVASADITRGSNPSPQRQCILSQNSLDKHPFFFQPFAFCVFGFAFAFVFPMFACPQSLSIPPVSSYWFIRDAPRVIRGEGADKHVSNSSTFGICSSLDDTHV